MAFLPVASTNINTVKRPEGGLVTGKSWRLHHSRIKKIPFYSGLANLDFLGEPLQKSLTQSSGNMFRNMLLVVRRDHFRVGVKFNILPHRNSPTVLTTFTLSATQLACNVCWTIRRLFFFEDTTIFGHRRASRVWGFMSKFVMLDRFATAFGTAEIFPGLHCARIESSLTHIGGAAKVNTFPLDSAILLIGLSDPRRAIPILETCGQIYQDLARIQEHHESISSIGPVPCQETRFCRRRIVCV